MSPQPIRFDATNIDLGSRIFHTATVAGSPADNTETIIAQLTVTGDLAVSKGVLLLAWAAFTVGTNGVSANLKIRQTNASGSTVAASGAVNEGVTAATQLGIRSAQGLDASPVLPGQIYVVTLTVASGSAASTVSGVSLLAVAV